jgi:hypothetical protein
LSKVIGADIPDTRTFTRVADPGLAMTKTFRPSRFLQATYVRFFDVPVDANIIAPLCMLREKCENPWYWPLRVISFVPEWIVSNPPHENGPMFGRPRSSSARFHPVIDAQPFLNTPMKVCAHVTQSVA